MRVVNQSQLPAERISELEEIIPAHENLRELMHWALDHPGEFLPQVVKEVVIQDEFTHDVVVPWREGLVIVYDTT